MKFFNKSKYESQYEKMTQEPVGELIVKLGIPTTLSMLVTNIYNMVDTMFVGQLGTSASGAIGIVFGFMAVLQAFGFMYGHGAGSIISRKLGSRDSETATKIASTSFFMALLTGTFISVLGMIYLEPLMYLLGSTDTILPYAKTYVWFIIIAAPFMVSTFVLNNILRYEGKAVLAMVGLLTGAVLNMFLDPLLMFGFDMGIAGAGLATGFSQFVSFCILLYMFLSGKTQSKLSIKRITRNISDVGQIITTGLPSLLRQGLSSVSTMALNNEAKIYGDAAVAAMSIVNRISMFIFSVGLGIGQGFQPVCGFNYGAKKYSRVKKAFWFTWGMGEVFMGIVAIAGIVFANQAIGIFRNDYEVIKFGTPALYYQCAALVFQPMTVLANMTLQSTGHSLSASFLSMLRSGIFFIPVLYIMTSAFGAFGVQTAQPIADVMSVIVSMPFIFNFLKKLPSDGKE